MSGRVTDSASLRPPIVYGDTTRVAPARSSLDSVSAASALETITRSGFGPLALRAINTLSLSFPVEATSPFARCTPVVRSTSSLVASPRTANIPASVISATVVWSLSTTTNGTPPAWNDLATSVPMRP